MSSGVQEEPVVSTLEKKGENNGKPKKQNKKTHILLVKREKKKNPHTPETGDL